MTPLLVQTILIYWLSLVIISDISDIIRYFLVDNGDIMVDCLPRIFSALKRPVLGTSQGGAWRFQHYHWPLILFIDNPWGGIKHCETGPRPPRERR